MSLTSVIEHIKGLNTSTGLGKTGLVFGNFTIKYLTRGGVLTALTPETIDVLGTYQAPSSAAHIRIRELNDTDPTKGVYQVHFHNDQVVEAGDKLWLFASAAGSDFQPLRLDLVPFETALSEATILVAASAVSLATITEANALRLHRGDYISFSLLGLGSLVNRVGEKIYFTVKRKRNDDSLTDDDAIIQVSETTGALILNGAAHGTAGDASITVDDAADGDITIVLKAGISRELVKNTHLEYDIQIIEATGPRTLLQADASVHADVTRKES